MGIHSCEEMYNLKISLYLRNKLKKKCATNCCQCWVCNFVYKWVDVVPPDRSLSPCEEADPKTGWVCAAVYGRGSEDAVGVRGSDA